MTRFIVRRRADGVVYLRRRSFRHLLVDRLAWTMALLFVGTVAATTALVAALVAVPLVVILLVVMIGLGIWAGRFARGDRLQPAPAPVDPRPPRRVA
jgi:uncharacterized membrane protein